MARKARSAAEIEEIRGRIIEEAMKLILEAGFDNLSLRKLARRVGMSATNIYYYYSSKDEIYLSIQIKGFGLLQQHLEAVPVAEDPYDTLRRMLMAYLEFGFNNPDYYQIMLNSDTPRYLEYKGVNQAVEPIAFDAKQMAVKAIAVPLKIIRPLSGNREDDAYFRAYQMWITLHGIVTLNNRNILLELDEIAPQELIERMCQDLMRTL